MSVGIKPSANPTLGISGAHEPLMMKHLLDARPLHAVVRQRV